MITTVFPKPASNDPFVTDCEPVALPPAALAEKAKVPAIRVVVSDVTVMVPDAPVSPVFQMFVALTDMLPAPPATLTPSTPSG